MGDGGEGEIWKFLSIKKKIKCGGRERWGAGMIYLLFLIFSFFFILFWRLRIMFKTKKILKKSELGSEGAKAAKFRIFGTTRFFFLKIGFET